MSLIQDALEKAQNSQNKISAPPPKKQIEKQIDLKITPRTDGLQGLDALDREVEREILQTKNKYRARAQSKKNTFIIIISMSIIFLSGAMYWAQNHAETEAVPPLVVGIERHQLLPRSNAPETPAASPTVSDSKAGFFLAGVAWGGEQPYAVINNQILRAGEAVDKKATLRSIGRDFVILESRSGEIIRLNVKR